VPLYRERAYALDVAYAGGDVSDYATWLSQLHVWLAEMLRVARPDWGRLCLNVPLDRDRDGWQPVFGDTINAATEVGWQFRTWLLWDKNQAGAGTVRGSIDSAAAPNITAPVESILIFYRGSWRRVRPRCHPTSKLAGVVWPARSVALPRHERHQISRAVPRDAARAMYHAL
jgi:site-specific DNA-methyltransferase (adenine-specific)